MMTMKKLMDAFHDNKRAGEDNYEFNAFMDLCETWANNCHQKTDAEIVEYIKPLIADYPNMVNGNVSAQEKEAMSEALLIVDIVCDL